MQVNPFQTLAMQSPDWFLPCLLPWVSHAEGTQPFTSKNREKHLGSFKELDILLICLRQSVPQQIPIYFQRSFPAHS